MVTVNETVLHPLGALEKVMNKFEDVAQNPAPAKFREPSAPSVKLGTVVGLTVVVSKRTEPLVSSVAIYKPSVLRYFSASK